MTKDDLIKKGKLAVIESACGICSLSEEQLLKRLEELYFKGVTAGGELTSGVFADVVAELSTIALAHLNNPQSVPGLLDDFCRRHVKVTQSNHHTTH